MADTYQDFLDLAKSLNIPLNTNANSVTPKLDNSQSELESALAKITADIKKAEESKSQGEAMGEASEVMEDMTEGKSIFTTKAQEELDDLIGFLFPKTEAGKARAEEKAIERMGERDAADYEARQKSMADMEEYLAGIAALENMGEADAADYLARQASLDKVKADSTTKEGGPDIVMKTPPTKEEKEAAQKRIEEASKEKDDKPKGLKDYIRKAFEDPEAIMAFGRALVEGRGISGGLEEYSKEREAGEKEQAALDTAAAELAFEKQKAEVDALYKAALAEQALGAAAKSKMGTKEIQNAQVIAAQAGKPGTLEYNQAFAKAMQDQITAKDDSMDFGDTLKLLALTGQLTPEKLKELYPQGTGEQLTTDGEGNIIFAEGV